MPTKTWTLMRIWALQIKATLNLLPPRQKRKRNQPDRERLKLKRSNRNSLPPNQLKNLRSLPKRQEERRIPSHWLMMIWHLNSLKSNLQSKIQVRSKPERRRALKSSNNSNNRSKKKLKWKLKIAPLCQIKVALWISNRNRVEAAILWVEAQEDLNLSSSNIINNRCSKCREDRFLLNNRECMLLLLWARILRCSNSKKWCVKRWWWDSKVNSLITKILKKFWSNSIPKTLESTNSWTEILNTKMLYKNLLKTLRSWQLSSKQSCSNSNKAAALGIQILELPATINNNRWVVGILAMPELPLITKMMGKIRVVIIIDPKEWTILLRWRVVPHTWCPMANQWASNIMLSKCKCVECLKATNNIHTRSSKVVDPSQEDQDNSHIHQCMAKAILAECRDQWIQDRFKIIFRCWRLSNSRDKELLLLVVTSPQAIQDRIQMLTKESRPWTSRIKELLVEMFLLMVVEQVDLNNSKTINNSKVVLKVIMATMSTTKAALQVKEKAQFLSH